MASTFIQAGIIFDLYLFDRQLLRVVQTLPYSTPSALNTASTGSA